MRKLMGWLLDNKAEDMVAAERVFEAEAAWLQYTIFDPPGILQAPPTRKVVTSVSSFPPGTGSVSGPALMFIMDPHTSFVADMSRDYCDCSASAGIHELLVPLFQVRHWFAI